ncbi:MAG: hypothetical protein ACXIVQ_10625 [Acidimicrobiales bacterium]
MLSRLRPLLLVLAVVLVAVGCGDESDDGYSAETRAAFMEGCVEDSDDPDLVAVCECTYETAESELPFERFRAAERDLVRGATEVPGEVTDLVIDCIRTVSATR